jgi:hypothetical protein
MRYLLILGALLALLLASGCAYMMAVEGQQGKAWVAGPGAKFMWNCEAAGGKPKCYKVIKQ